MFYSGHCVKYSVNPVVVIEEDMIYRFKQIHSFEWNETESTRIPCPKSKLPTQCACWTSGFLLLWFPSNWQLCSTIWSWALRNPWAFFESSYLELCSSVCWKQVLQFLGYLAVIQAARGTGTAASRGRRKHRSTRHWAHFTRLPPGFPVDAHQPQSRLMCRDSEGPSPVLPLTEGVWAKKPSWPFSGVNWLSPNFLFHSEVKLSLSLLKKATLRGNNYHSKMKC